MDDTMKTHLIHCHRSLNIENSASTFCINYFFAYTKITFESAAGVWSVVAAGTKQRPK